MVVGAGVVVTTATALDDDELLLDDDDDDDEVDDELLLDDEDEDDIDDELLLDDEEDDEESVWANTDTANTLRMNRNCHPEPRAIAFAQTRTPPFIQKMRFFPFESQLHFPAKTSNSISCAISGVQHKA